MEDEDLVSCVNCNKLKMEIEMNRATLAMNFSTIRRKLIISDLLTRDNAAKTQEYNVQSKKLENATQLVEQLQRDCVKYESELSRILQEVEPLRDERSTLIASNKTISEQLETVQENLRAAKKVEEQYSLMIKDHHKSEEKLREKITTLKQGTSQLNNKLSQLKKLKEESHDWKNEHQRIGKTLSKTKKKFLKCIKHLMAFGDNLRCHKLLTRRDKGILDRYAAQVSSNFSGDSENGSESDSECDIDGQLIENIILNNDTADQCKPTTKKMIDVAVSAILPPPSELNSEMLFDLLDSCIYRGSLLSPLPPAPDCGRSCKLAKNHDNPKMSEKNCHSAISEPSQEMPVHVNILSNASPRLKSQTLESNLNIRLSPKACQTVQRDDSSISSDTTIANKDVQNIAAKHSQTIQAETHLPDFRNGFSVDFASSADTNDSGNGAVSLESFSSLPKPSSCGIEVIASHDRNTNDESCINSNDRVAERNCGMSKDSGNMDIENGNVVSQNASNLNLLIQPSVTTSSVKHIGENIENINTSSKLANDVENIMGIAEKKLCAVGSSESCTSGVGISSLWDNCSYENNAGDVELHEETPSAMEVEAIKSIAQDKSRLESCPKSVLPDDNGTTITGSAAESDRPSIFTSNVVQQNVLSENFDQSDMIVEDIAGGATLMEVTEETNEAQAEGTAVCPLPVISNVIAMEHSYSYMSRTTSSTSDVSSPRIITSEAPTLQHNSADINKEIVNLPSIENPLEKPSEIVTSAAVPDKQWKTSEGNSSNMVSTSVPGANSLCAKDKNVEIPPASQHESVHINTVILDVPHFENLLEKPSEIATSDAVHDKQCTLANGNRNNRAFTSALGANNLCSEDNIRIKSANSPVNEMPVGEVLRSAQNGLHERDKPASALENSEASMVMQCRQIDVPVSRVFSCNNSSQIANELVMNESVGVVQPNMCKQTEHTNLDEARIANESETGATQNDYFPETTAENHDEEQMDISAPCPNANNNQVSSSCDVEGSWENCRLPSGTNPEPSNSAKPVLNRKSDEIQSPVNSCEFLNENLAECHNKSVTKPSLEGEQCVAQGSSIGKELNSHVPKRLVRNCQPAKSRKTVRFFRLGKTVPSNWDGSLQLDPSERHSDRVSFLKKGSFLKNFTNVDRSPAQSVEHSKEKCLQAEGQSSTILKQNVTELNDDNSSERGNQMQLGHCSSVQKCSHNCNCIYDENAIFALRPLFIRALLGENKCHQCCQFPAVEPSIHCAHNCTPTNTSQTPCNYLENTQFSPNNQLENIQLSPNNQLENIHNQLENIQPSQIPPVNDKLELIKSSVITNAPSLKGGIVTSAEKVTVVAKSSAIPKNKTKNRIALNINSSFQQTKSTTGFVNLTAEPSPPDISSDNSRLENKLLQCNKSDFSQGSIDASNLKNNLPPHCNKASFSEVSTNKNKMARKKSLRERILVSLKHPHRKNLNIQKPVQLTVKSKSSKPVLKTFPEITKEEVEVMLNQMVLSEEYKKPLSPIRNKTSSKTDENKIAKKPWKPRKRKRSVACVQEVQKEINVTPDIEGSCNVKIPTPKSGNDCSAIKKRKTSDNSSMEVPSNEHSISLPEDVREDTTIDIEMRESSNFSTPTSLLLPPNNYNVYNLEYTQSTTRNSKLSSRIIDNIVQLLTPLPPDGHLQLWKTIINRLGTSLSAKHVPLLSKKLSNWMASCTIDPLSAIAVSKYAKPEDNNACEFSLSETEKKCLHLVQQLRVEAAMEKIEEEIAVECMKSILNNDLTTLGRASLCRFYIALCKLQENIERARIFCYDIIYHIYKMCGPLLVNAIGVWPEIVTCESHGDNSLLMVFLFALSKESAIIGFKKEFSAQRFLSSWYSLTMPTCDTNELTSIIINRLKIGQCNESFEAMKALELLGRIEGWEWANNCLIRELWPSLHTWCQPASADSEKITDRAMANCLYLIGCLTKQCPAAYKVSAVGMSITMRALLEKSLTVPLVWCVQEATVLVTLMLLPYDREATTTALKNWILKNKGQISDSMKELLTRAKLMSQE